MDTANVDRVRPIIGGSRACAPNTGKKLSISVGSLPVRPPASCLFVTTEPLMPMAGAVARRSS